MAPIRARFVPLSLTFILLTSSAPAIYAQSELTPVKITDAKLHSIDYGIDSLMHWVQKARPGDASRASSLMRDHGKLVTRFNRIPKSDSEQYEYVSSRLSRAQKEIAALTNEAEHLPSGSRLSPSSDRSERSHPDLINIASQLDSLQTDIRRYRDNHKQRNRMRSDLDTLRIRFNRLPRSGHPDYLAVQEQLKSVETKLQPSSVSPAMSADEVNRYLSEIQTKYRERVTLPEALDIIKTGEL